MSVGLFVCQGGWKWIKVRKILGMTFSKNSKTQRLPQKHPKTKNWKTSKSHVRRPQIKKKFRKETIVRIKKY